MIKPDYKPLLLFFPYLPLYRNLNVSEDDDRRSNADEDSGDIISGLQCKIVVQFEKYKDFHNALKVLCSRSLQKVCLPFSVFNNCWSIEDTVGKNNNRRLEV